jgi:hypothetical protein
VELRQQGTLHFEERILPARGEGYEGALSREGPRDGGADAARSPDD